MTAFLLLIAGCFILMHYYCYNRICFYLELSGKIQQSIAYLFLFMMVFAFAWLPFIRHLPLEYARIIGWIMYPWIGILVIMFAVFVTGDVFAGTIYLTLSPSLQDGGRRIFIKQVLGFVMLGSVGGLSLISLKNGIRPAQVKEVPIRLTRLPDAFNGFHIAQVTDLHVSATHDGPWVEHVVEKTNALNPDIVALTGDFVDGDVDRIGRFLAPLGRLRARYGVYFITGNHEYYSGVGQWVAFMKSLGIRVLMNECVPITVNGQTIDLAGTEDHDSKRFDGHREDLQKALVSHNPDTPVILLAHQPVTVLEAARMNVDLQLSGHTHGGQIRPFDYAVRLRQPYVAGLHQHPGSTTQIYVSSGTGYWGPPMRLGTMSEITSIKLYKA